MNQADASEPSLRWQVQRRPSGKANLPIIVVAILLIVGGGIFGAMIHLERQPWFGLGVGALMAGLLWFGARRGTILSVDTAGWLTLNYGAKDNLRVHLSVIEDCQLIATTPWPSVGLRLSDYRAITFLHKSGHTFRSMEKSRSKCGMDLVLDFVNAEDCQQINALRQEFEQAPVQS